MNILLFGAGKSSAGLIEYLSRQDLTLTVVDKFATKPGVRLLDILTETDERRALITQADVVISLMPPALHQVIAADCLALGRHLLTASYVDPAIRNMASAIRDRGLLFLCEMGLDPGIDHMSSMRAIRRIRERGGEIVSFRSHTGGLVAPESDDNPWHYKVSWNPRNIVLAGKAGARFREEGVDRHMAYADLFDPRRLISVPDLGLLAWYPNRDSLEYASLYGLDHVPTFVRTTLRHPAFSSGWKHVVALHLTDEDPVYDTTGVSLAEWFRMHFRRFGWSEWLSRPGGLAELLRISPAEAAQFEGQLSFLGWNSGEIIGRGMASAADVLQWLLETRLALRPGDLDMVVMLHEIRYRLGGRNHEWQGSLVVRGVDAVHTAMAQTVGLPLGIAALLLVQGRISLRGLHIPTAPEIYEPVLDHLEAEGIAFRETD